MPIPMICRHLNHKNEVWTLDLDGPSARILDARGQVRSEFSHDDAVANFHMPSFSESIKQFRVPVDGDLWFFDVDREGLKTIAAYLDHNVVAAGTDAIAQIKSGAITKILVGFGLAGLGIAISVGTYLNAANGQGGRYTITYGLIIFGIIRIFVGLGDLARFAKLKRASEAVADR